MMQLIDPERLDILRMLAEDDPDFLNTVIDAYLPQLDNAPKELLAALEAQDTEAVIRASHSLKGSSSNLGAQAIGDLCIEIESRARKGSLDGVDDLIGQLGPIAQETAKYFESQKT